MFAPHKISISDISQIDLKDDESYDISDEYLILGKEECPRTKALLKKINIANDPTNRSYYSEKEDLDVALKQNAFLIDVSCLPRKQIAVFFQKIGQRLEAEFTDINLSIAYTLSKYTPPRDKASVNKEFKPITPYFSGTIMDIAVPLNGIISLGYEKNNKALGISEYLELTDKWIFTPTSPEEEFAKQVFESNKHTLAENQDNRLPYRVLEPMETFYKLQSLVRGLIPENQIAILPLGPKIFFSISLLTAMLYKEISIWHVDCEEEDMYGSTLKASPYSVIFKFKLSSVSSIS